MKKFFKNIGKGIGIINKTIIGFLLIVFCVLLYIPFKIIFPIKIVGKKNLKNCPDGKLISCNHYSNFDVWILNIFFFKATWRRKYLAKKELGENIFTRTLVGGLGAIFINRNALDMKAMKQTLKELKKGKNVIIFPEGTRNKTESENLQDLKSGIIFFAEKSNSYIVPMLIKHRIRPFRKNKIIISEPYKVTFTGKEGQAKELEKLNCIYADLKNQ